MSAELRVSSMYAYVQDVAGEWDSYRRVAEATGDSPPDGMMIRVAGTTTAGFRIIEVWESRDAWEAFRHERLRPAMSTIGGDESSISPVFEGMAVRHAIFNPGSFRAPAPPR